MCVYCVVDMVVVFGCDIGWLGVMFVMMIFGVLCSD